VPVWLAQVPRHDREDTTTHSIVTAALRALLERVVDYAGMYPPASEDLPTAARNYQSYRSSDDRWMLGRFVVGVAKLGELRAVIASLRPRDTPWPVTVVAPDAAAATGVIRAVDIGAIQIQSIEVKAKSVADVALLAKAADRKREVYVEIALDATLDTMLDAIGAAKLRAKIRTGGVTANAFPMTDDVVRFLRGCADRNLAFKATAGLHHPLRGSYRLTYEAAATSGPMFGFLNLFLAAVFMRDTSFSNDDARALLEETDAAAFGIQDQTITWRDRVVNVEAIREARARFATSFGSCSFREPVDELPYSTVAST
jgi:hypothetical protein